MCRWFDSAPGHHIKSPTLLGWAFSHLAFPQAVRGFRRFCVCHGHRQASHETRASSPTRRRYWGTFDGMLISAIILKVQPVAIGFLHIWVFPGLRVEHLSFCVCHRASQASGNNESPRQLGYFLYPFSKHVSGIFQPSSHKNIFSASKYWQFAVSGGALLGRRHKPS